MPAGSFELTRCQMLGSRRPLLPRAIIKRHKDHLAAKGIQTSRSRYAIKRMKKKSKTSKGMCACCEQTTGGQMVMEQGAVAAADETTPSRDERQYSI